MDTAFSSGRSTPLNWDDCEDNTTCEEVAEFLDDEEELEVSARVALCLLSIYTYTQFST